MDWVQAPHTNAFLKITERVHFINISLYYCVSTKW